MTIQLFDMLPH